ncbi:MAG TPA: hypothetical protein PKY82_06320 [Pyrinomonadaceae bacterium]|nr:hypothetical protein [Pyrinomonadaceae bacterium]
MSDKLIKKNRIEGRVAQILNARELIINIGEEKGVRLKMRFAVLASEPLEVRDPETGDLLDIIDREKVRVEATEVRAKITICRTYKFKIISGGPLYTTLSGIGAIGDFTRPPQKIVETLEAKNSSLPPPLSPEDSYVKINDRVIQISDSD